ncbi:MAG: 1,4-dihydroxy-2-naphthoate polyprenyltransferase [Actinobacteria bacterium]|nr:1,4-dihydroxy-2-naphthoate polyprenyltransferase [Actinomycetota bacterium]
MTSREIWIKGARPKTLVAAIAPVIVGTAFAGYDAEFLNFLLALLVALALQIGVNYANDYSDGVHGVDDDRVGPIRLVGSGLAKPADVKRAAFLAFAVAAFAGLILSARSEWYLLIAGALAIIAAWTYTGGPKPYGYQALGEVSVFIFFGLVATLGTYFVQVGSISWPVVLAAISMGLLATAILNVNNLRDLERDGKSGKRTLAVRLGAARTRALYRVTIFLPLLLSLVLLTKSNYFLLTLIVLPQLLRVSRIVNTNALIELLGKTGRIQITYSLALSLASLLAAR